MSNRFAVIAVAAGCVAAAGAGGFLAMRQNVTPAPVSAAAPSVSPVTTPVPAATVNTPQPVQETEGVVGDTAAKPAPPPAEEPKPAPPSRSKASPVAKRAEPAPRPAQRTAKNEPSAQTPTLERPWPATASQTPDPAQSQAPSTPGPLTPSDGSSLPPQHDAQQASEPEKTIEELVVPADSVVGLQTETALSSERARVEDRVEARVTRDVRVGDRVAIPAGARALGTVTMVVPGGKFKERARLGVRFHTIVLADGTRLPISTDPLYRDGDAPGGDASKKIGGGAAVGAILGAIIGGAKGAAIGAATGGGAGTAAVVAGDRSAATLPAGSPVTVRLLSPVTVTLDK